MFVQSTTALLYWGREGGALEVPIITVPHRASQCNRKTERERERERGLTSTQFSFSLAMCIVHLFNINM